MNPITTTNAAPRPPVRVTTPTPIVPRQAPEVSEGVASLSLQTRVDLSQKAQVAPPPPPTETRKPKTSPQPMQRSEGVCTTDFTGRTCSGTLSGPLLMEEPLAELPQDSAALEATGRFFALLDSELLTAERSDQPLASKDDLHYYGVLDGVALVTHSQPLEASGEERHIVLPEGGVVRITQAEGRLSLYLPAESLGEMVSWGKRLLAEA